MEGARVFLSTIQAEMGSTPTRVLYLIDKLTRAGAQRHLCQLTAALERKNFMPVVCCLLFRGPLAEELEAQGVRVRSLDLPNIMAGRFPVAVGRVACFAREAKVDLIHSYLFAANVTAPWAGLLTGTPVITSRRDTGFWKKKKHILAHRLCNLLTSRITANSKPVVEYLVRREKASPAKVVLIPNGIELRPEFEWASRRSSFRERVVLGCLGNVRPVKGYEFLLAALKHPAVSTSVLWELRIGGQILDHDCHRRLLREASHPRLRGRVFFRGEITDVPGFMKEIDIFILPSLAEGFSNSLLEAMAAGRAIVATEAGGNAEVIRGGKDGFLVPAGDAPALAQKISRLMEDPLLASRLGESGRKRVGSSFSSEQMCRRMEELYRQVLRTAD